MSARGFTLVELLVATLVLTALAGALTALAVPMQRGFDRSLAGGEVTSRGRTALLSVVGELRDAGTGAMLGRPPLVMADVVPVVVPSRSLTDPRPLGPFTAVTILRAGRAQALVAASADAGSTLLLLDAEAPSVDQDGTGGFRRGDLAVVYDMARAELVSVAAVSPTDWTLSVSPPLRHRFDAGTIVAAVVRTTFATRPAADGTLRLMRVTPGGAEQPVADDVQYFALSLWGFRRDGGDASVLEAITPDLLNDGPWLPEATAPDRFDIDLLRVRRIDLELGLETALTSLRALVPPTRLTASVALRTW